MPGRDLNLQYQLALLQHLYLYGLCVQTYRELKITITALQSEDQTFPLIHRLWTTTGNSGCYAVHLVTKWTIRLDYIHGSIFQL